MFLISVSQYSVYKLDNGLETEVINVNQRRVILLIYIACNVPDTGLDTSYNSDVDADND